MCAAHSQLKAFYSELAIDQLYHSVEAHKLGEWTVYKTLYAGTADEARSWVATVSSESLANWISDSMNRGTIPEK